MSDKFERYNIPVNNETADMSVSPARFKGIEAVAGYILKRQYLPSILPRDGEAAAEMESAYMRGYLRNKLIEYIKKENDISKTIYGNQGYAYSVIINIPAWDEFLGFFPQCPTHREGQTCIKLSPAFEEYRLDGTYAGKRKDGEGGIWVKDDHLRDANGYSIMSIKDFTDLAGTIYEEASRNGYPVGKTPDPKEPVREEQLRQEAAAMYCVLRNRAKIKQWTIRDAASESDRTGKNFSIRGWGVRENNIDIYKKYSPDDPDSIRAACVIKGFITANRGTYDYSEGAYFWDGSDIKTNNHNKIWGIKYTDDKHDIYNTGNTLTVDVNKEYYPEYDNGNIIGYKFPLVDEKGRRIKWCDAPNIHDSGEKVEIFTHKLDSTIAFGGTVFWKICPIFKIIIGYRGY